MWTSFITGFLLRILAILTPVVIFVLIFFGINQQFEQQSKLKQEQHIVEALSTRINARLRNLTAEFQVLKSSGELKQYAEKQDEHSRRGVQERLLSFAEATNHYDQVRLLSLSGQEIVRVNYSLGKSTLTVEQELQNKSTRPYFNKSIQLPLNHIYVSPLDLNLEQGQVQEPWKPMLRLSTLIYDSHGQAQAVLVLNFLAKYILEELSQLDQLHEGSIMLLNSQGYRLYGGNKDQLWAFMFDKNIRFEHLHNDAWFQIKGTTAGQISSADGVFTYKTIRFPVFEGHLNVEAKGIREWKVVSRLTNELVSNQTQSDLKLLLVLGPIVIFFIAWVSWLWNKASISASIRQQRVLELSRIVEQSEEIVYTTDTNGNIQYVNPAFEVITGYKAFEVIGKHARILKSGKHNTAFYERMWNTIVEGKPFQQIFINRKKDGSFYYEEKLITPIYDKDSGQIIQFVSTGRDISEMRQIKEKQNTLHKLAYHDPLTGLSNRTHLNEQLVHAIHSADRLEKQVAVLFLDLDGFKLVNDTFGHKIGDALLREVAERLQRVFRKTDTVGRIGGDEFLIIMEYIDQKDAAELLAKKLIQEISKPYYFDETEANVTASVGLSLYPTDAISAEQLIELADKAMYKSKKRGKNCYHFIQSVDNK